MQIALESPIRTRASVVVVLASVSVHVVVAALDFAASWLSDRQDLPSLQRAARIDRWNAEYAYLVGRYFDLVGNDPVAALAQYRRAVQLNPHNARNWLA